MKQHIKKEQWDELSEDQKRVYLGVDDNTTMYGHSYTNIGQMIEYLGDDWDSYTSLSENLVVTPNNDDLCDALWEAVKEKLKQ